MNRSDDLDGCYADEALQLFMQEIRNAGTHPCEYSVKMLGGGNQLLGHGIHSGTIFQKK